MKRYMQFEVNFYSKNVTRYKTSERKQHRAVKQAIRI